MPGAGEDAGEDREPEKAPGLDDAIYKHLPHKHASKSAVISAGFEEQAEGFESARTAKDPWVALAQACRDFALTHRTCTA